MEILCITIMEIHILEGENGEMYSDEWSRISFLLLLFCFTSLLAFCNMAGKLWDGARGTCLGNVVGGEGCKVVHSESTILQ